MYHSVYLLFFYYVELLEICLTIINFKKFMKKIQNIVAIFIATFSLFVIANAYPKQGLIERFTGVNCGPCATYNSNGYSEWVRTNANDVTIITFHLNAPAGAEPIYEYNTDITRGRWYYYGDMTGVPAVKVEGGLLNGSSQPKNSALDTWKAQMDATTSPFLVTPTFTLNGNVANIAIDVLADNAVSGAKLHIVLAEYCVFYETAPGSNGETEFPFVARHAFPTEDMAGETVSIAAGETLHREYTINMDNVMVPENLYVIAWLEQSKGNILQSGKSAKFGTIGTLGTETEQTSLYAKVPNNDITTHNFTIKNISTCKVTVLAEPLSDWQIASADFGSSFEMEPGEELSLSYSLLTPDKPASNISEFSFDVDYPGEAGTFYFTQSSSVAFIDVTANTKYAYLYNDPNNLRIYPSWNAVTYFENELVPIYNSISLYATNILDDMKFVALTTADGSALFANDVVAYGGIVTNKLKQLNQNGTKIFLNASSQYYYMLGYYSYYPTELTALRSFFTNLFGVNNSATNYNNSYLGLASSSSILTLPATATPNDPAAAGDFVANGAYGSSYPYYSAEADFYTSVEPTASSVYTLPAVSNYTLMAKNVVNSDMNRKTFISGLEFISVPPATLGNLADNIVTWLFATNSVTDGETNLTSKNGMTLNTYPNPVATTATITITSDCEQNVTLKLVDEAGNTSYNLYSGNVNVGDNTFNLNAVNIPSGKYFAVVENERGRTIMSVVIRK